jgi:radical SAM superfamily enzyme YgiQ (UPF0313 family)
MKKILLVSPEAENEALWVTGEETCLQACTNFLPVGLATVAAMTPDTVQVDIWDELVHGRIDDHTQFREQYDLVGVTGYKAHLLRCRQVAAVFRKRGIPVAIGGPGVSGCPDAYRPHFDYLFIGEAEKTWPQFVRDWERGQAKREYRQIEKPDLADSPRPKWDSLLDVFPKYAMGCVQTTRGCPFDCEFCDVIYLFGRRSRHKPIPHIIEELRALYEQGKDTIMVCDDEFIGDPRYAKELCRELIKFNNSLPRPMSFSTQLTMNLSKDPELLELVADANFNLVFIGIETPNPESLKETGKFQNLRKDLVADVQKILAHGIAIRAGIIVGFDHDGPDIFDMQFDFIQRACLQSIAINMLKAPLETKLWTRLRQEGRVVSLAKITHLLGPSRSYTNILPKMMNRVELLRGYRWLQLQVHNWQTFGERIKGFVSLVKRVPRVKEEPLGFDEALAMCTAPDPGPEARRVIEDILRHTERVCPFMMRRVKIIIVQFRSYLETMAKLIPAVDLQIEREEAGSFPLELDPRTVPVPPGFREDFEKIFHRLYGRVYVNLTDKSQVPEALAEMFVDFLVAWGKDFERLEDYHLAYLEEICDRTCAKCNGQPPQEFVPVPVGTTALPNVKRTRLAEDILKTVEQEMMKLAHTALAADLPQARAPIRELNLVRP